MSTDTDNGKPSPTPSEAAHVATGGPHVPAHKDKLQRETSKIAFAYVPLDAAEEGIKRIFDSAGTTEITLAQAASAMSASSTSSSFRGEVAAMKLFGLLAGDQGRVRLTELGRAIAEEESAKSARARAFLNVELYARVKEQHNGKTLPKPQALEHEFVEWGVPKKQAPRARQVFDRSAKHAEFIKAGSDRFVEPIIPRSQLLRDSEQRSGRGGESQTTDPPAHQATPAGMSAIRHPFIEGLLKTLPEPEADWPIEARVKWLQTAASIFGLIYKGEGDISVSFSAASTKISGDVR